MELSSIPTSIYNAGVSFVNGAQNLASQAWSSVSSREALASTVTSIGQAIISKNGQLTIVGFGAAYALRKTVAQYNAEFEANSSPSVIIKNAVYTPLVEFKPAVLNEDGTEKEPAVQAQEPKLVTDAVYSIAKVANRLDCVKAAKKPLIAATLLTVAAIARAII